MAFRTAQAFVTDLTTCRKSGRGCLCQLNPRRKVIDPQALRDARPDRVEPTVIYAGLPLVTAPSLGPVTAFGQVGSVTVVIT